MPLSTPQITQMRSAYDNAMHDRCTLKVRTNSAATSGQPVGSFATLATGVLCGFETSPFKFRAREIVAGGEGTSEMLVRARLPISYYTSIDQEDRIILTSRAGDTLVEEETYEIQGFLERGPAGLIANLKRVEP